MRFSLPVVLKTALVLGCVGYVLHGVDVARLADAVENVNLFGLSLFLAVLILDFCIMGLRLRYLSRGQLTVSAGINAAVLGVGLNNVLPAKLGEVAKCVFIAKSSGGTLGQVLGIIFWERFSDINCLLLFSCVAALASGNAIAGPLVVLVCGLWVAVLAVRLRPSIVPFLARFVYFQKLRLIALDLGNEVAGGLGAGRFFKLGLLSLGVWTLYWGQYAGFLVGAAGVDLGVWQTLAVFVIGAGGMAVPSSPGGVGVFEAAMVLALTLFGIEKEIALATAVMLHLALALPAVVWAGVVILKSGMTIRELRGAKAATE